MIEERPKSWVSDWIAEGEAKEDAKLANKRSVKSSGSTPHGLLKKKCREILKELRPLGGKACLVPIHNMKVEKKDKKTGRVANYMTGRPGASDDIILWDGIAFAVEYKAGRDIQSEKQKSFQSSWEDAGGAYIIARDPTQLKKDMIQIAHQRGRGLKL